MKKKIKIVLIVLVISLFIIISCIFISKYIEKRRIENAKIIVVLKEDLTVPFNSEIKLSDFIEEINGKLIEDTSIDTLQLGKKEIKFKYINEDNIKVSYKFNIEIIDNTPPLIWLGSTYTVTTKFEESLTDKIMCADDTDDNPKCYIEGYYDIKKSGTYDLTYKAEDASGNMSDKKFKLIVNEPKSSSGQTTSHTRTEFSDIINEYREENTKVGIDVSTWQGDIDFEKLKNAGVEFAIIRVGFKKKSTGEYILDSKFTRNIEGFNKADIPVGIYFYSYSKTKEEANEDAKWVISQIKDYKVDLPIAYDWEDWSNYNNYHISMYNLSNNAKVFLDTVKKSGYKGMLYSSKSYLESIWFDIGYPVWLAHYTKKTNYEGNYIFWQMCNDGKVDGIYGDVDIDIMYL